MYIYIYMYIFTLLEGTILGNGTKRAAKRRHSNIQFFLLKGGMGPMGQAPPNAAPGPYGPILASSGEIGVSVCVRALCWG